MTTRTVASSDPAGTINRAAPTSTVNVGGALAGSERSTRASRTRVGPAARAARPRFLSR